MRRLTGKVVKVESAESFTDSKRRATIRVEQADSMYREVRLSMEDFEFELDQEVVITVTVAGRPEKAVA
jgi:hypothetical protein